MTPSIVFWPAMALLLILPEGTRAPAVEFPGLPKHLTSHLAIAALSDYAKRYDSSKAACDEKDALRTEFMERVTDFAKRLYAAEDNHKALDNDVQQAIGIAVASVLKFKLCTTGKDVIAPASTYKATHPKGTQLTACDTVRENAVGLHAKEPNYFKTNFATLFASCNCVLEKEKALGTGAAGVVFLVKMTGAGPLKDKKLAMKIAECGTLNTEIYAQQKLQSAGVTWVNKMHSWDRSAGAKAKWEYYIMDTIHSNVEATLNPPSGKHMGPQQLGEMLRMLLEAAREMHTHGIAHTDLRLENMGFVENESKQLKIIDFGVAMPVTAENAVEAFNDYWRIAEIVDEYKQPGLPGGAQPLHDILNNVGTQILDGKPLSAATGEFPKPAFFSGLAGGKVLFPKPDFASSSGNPSVYDQFMAKFVDLKWIESKANTKKMVCAIPKLFDSLPPPKP